MVYFPLACSPQAAMHNVLCNRLLLRLRSANSALTEVGFLSIHFPDADGGSGTIGELSTTLPTFRTPDSSLGDLGRISTLSTVATQTHVQRTQPEGPPMQAGLGEARCSVVEDPGAE